MPHPLPSSPLVPRSRAIPVAPPSRSRLAAATAASGALLAGATLLLTPRPAHASDGLYEACLDAVHGMALHCLDSADNLLGDLACMWMGGLGYIACAALEAIRQLLPGGLNVS